ncbi:MAG: cobalamin biosynthesis protein CbiG [Chitinivibrionales bacterium]|nr:cobalamin biosynthesis protein CbiG [Chitinivibrionales bacterium]
MRGLPNNCAVIAVSQAGLRTATHLVTRGFSAVLFGPQSLPAEYSPPAKVNWFDDGIHALTERVFGAFDGLVYVMPMGIVVRAIAPHLRSKHTDPAVVTVDVGGRWAVATLSGHEGGANDLAACVARCLRCEPVVTTSTEAEKTLVAGIGCRKGVSAQDIETAVITALDNAGCDPAELRLIATVDAKEREEGLLAFCQKHKLPLRVISREEIREARINCEESEFVRKTLGIGAVAVPCALLGGTKTQLITDRIACCQVTVALARENCMW